MRAEEKRKENFINETFEKDPKFKAALESFNRITDIFEKMKEYKNLKRKVLEENEASITELTKTVKEEIAKQEILP